MTRPDDVRADQPPRGDEAGAGSTPADEGEGVVGLGSRTGGGSPAANQSKTEPMPPTSGHGDPDAAPEPTLVEPADLGSMSVGAADPQSPSHALAAAPGDRHTAGLPELQTSARGDWIGNSTGEDLGPPTAAEAAFPSSGQAFRAAGSNGVEGEQEQLSTDVEVSASRMTPAVGVESGPGDAAGVPVASEDAAAGTSEESAVAKGLRAPE